MTRCLWMFCIGGGIASGFALNYVVANPGWIPFFAGSCALQILAILDFPK